MSRLLFSTLLLFYPLAYTGYAKLQLGILELNGDDILIILLIFSIGFSEIARTKTYGPDLFIKKKIPTKIKAAIACIILYLFGKIICKIIHGEPVVYISQTIGEVLAFVIAAMVLARYNFTHYTTLFLKLSALLLSLSALLFSYGYLSPSLLNTKLSYRAFLGANYASTGLVAARGGYGVNIAFILPFVLHSIFPFTTYRSTQKGVARSVLCRALNGFLFLTLIWSVIITGSRSTWLMVLIVLGIYFTFLIFQKIQSENRHILYFLFGLEGLIVFGFTVKSICSGIIAVYNISKISVDSRFFINIVALKAFMVNPIIGLSFKEIIEISGTHLQIHNFFLDILARQGFFGILPIIVFFYIITSMLYYMAFRAPVDNRWLGLCLVSGFFGMLVELMFYNGGDKQLWIYLGIICGIYARCIYLAESHAKKVR